MKKPHHDRRALVVGLGISGIATAIRLRQIGWTPVIIERTAGRRAGGYFLALFGSGRAAAERLGILEHLSDRWPGGSSYLIDRSGRQRPGLSFKDFPGPPWTMLRSDIEEAAFTALPSDVVVRFGTVPTRIEQDADGVQVTTTDTSGDNARTESFDLVVGADGLRSTVRQLTFGPHERFLRRMNTMAVAYHLPTALPGHDQTDAVILAEPHRSMWVFPFAGQPPTVLLSYRTTDVEAEFSQSRSDRVRLAFGPEPTGPVLGAALRMLDEATDVLFDSVEQVQMETWSRGRVVLLGDAAWCATLYSGMGASAGLAGADLLGTLLDQHPDDVAAAVLGWERRLRPSILGLQASGDTMRSLFVPNNRFELGLNRVMARLNRGPVVAPLLARWRNNNKAARLKEADFANPVEQSREHRSSVSSL